VSADHRQEAVAYLLDELDGTARTAFETRLNEDARLRAEVGALAPVVGRLERLDAKAWDPPEAPPPPRPAPAAEPSRPRARRRRALPAWAVVAAACALLGLGVLGGVLLSGEGTPDGPATATPGHSTRSILRAPTRSSA
jgi:anti-sigma factor RsiW